MRIIVFIVLNLFVNYKIFANSQKMVYSLGELEESKPTVIKEINTLHPQEIYMQDPFEPQTTHVQIEPKRQAPKNVLKIKPARFNLEPLVVKGRYAKPRVDFQSEPLPEGLVFEPIEEDFTQKIYNVDIAN